MNRTDEKKLNTYFRQIRGWLPCSLREKKRIIEKIRVRVSEYLEEHPQADFSMIRAHFGEPKAIAVACMEEMDTVDLLKTLRIRQRIQQVAVCTAMALVLMWGIGVGIAVWENHKSANGTVEMGAAIIIDETVYGDERSAQ